MKEESAGFGRRRRDEGEERSDSTHRETSDESSHVLTPSSKKERESVA